MTSQNDAVLRRLQAEPNKWISLPQLEEATRVSCISRSSAIHSRINDLRNRGYNIKNKVEQDGHKRKSYYKLKEEL